MEAIATRYRSHTAGQLRKGDVGTTVRLAGWVHSYRDHGGLVFIDLRDRDGLTQLVFNADTCGAAHPRGGPATSATTWVLAVTGKVVAREPKLVNPKLGTGEVEVHVTAMDVLSMSPTPPFRPGDHDLANEELRLAHRYLDPPPAGDAADAPHPVPGDEDHARPPGRAGLLGDRDAVPHPQHARGQP